MHINPDIFDFVRTSIIYILNRLDTIWVGNAFTLLDLGIAFVIIGVLFPVLFNMFSNIVNTDVGGANGDFKKGG